MGINVGEVEAVLVARDNMSPTFVAAAETVVKLRTQLGSLTEQLTALQASTSGSNESTRELMTRVSELGNQLGVAETRFQALRAIQDQTTISTERQAAAEEANAKVQIDGAAARREHILTAEHEASAFERASAAQLELSKTTTDASAAEGRAIIASEEHIRAMDAEAEAALRLATAQSVAVVSGGSAPRVAPASAAAGFAPLPGSPIANIGSSVTSAGSGVGASVEVIGRAEEYLARLTTLVAVANSNIEGKIRGTIGESREIINKYGDALGAAETRVRAMTSAENVAAIQTAAFGVAQSNTSGITSKFTEILSGKNKELATVSGAMTTATSATAAAGATTTTFTGVTGRAAVALNQLANASGGGADGIKKVSNAADNGFYSFSRFGTRILESMAIFMVIRGAIDFAETLYADAQALTLLSDRSQISIGLLQQLQYQGERLSIPFTTVQTAIDQFDKKLADMNTTTQDALAPLHLSIMQLFEMSPADRFEAVATAIAHLPDQLQRTQAEFKLFGTDAIDPLIKQFEAVRDAADRAVNSDATQRSLSATAAIYRGFFTDIKQGAGEAIARFYDLLTLTAFPIVGGAFDISKLLSSGNARPATTGEGMAFDVGLAPPFKTGSGYDEQWRKIRELATGVMSGLPLDQAMDVVNKAEAARAKATASSNLDFDTYGSNWWYDASGKPTSKSWGPTRGKARIDELQEELSTTKLPDEMRDNLEWLNKHGLLTVEEAGRQGATTAQFRMFRREQRDDKAADRLATKDNKQIAVDESNTILNSEKEYIEATQQGFQARYSILQAEHEAHVRIIEDPRTKKSQAVKDADLLAEETKFGAQMQAEVERETDAVASIRERSDSAIAQAAERDGTRTLADRVARINQDEANELKAADRKFGVTAGQMDAEYAIQLEYASKRQSAQADADKHFETEKAKLETDIEALEEAGATRGYSFQLAKINKQEELEVASIKRSADTETQKQTLITLAEQRGIDARSNLDVAEQSRVNRELATINEQAQEAEINLFETGAQREISIAVAKHDKRLQLLHEQNLDYASVIDGENALLDRQVALIVTKYDPLWQAWLHINDDMRNEWAKTWDSLLSNTSTFTNVTSRLVSVEGGGGQTRFVSELDEAREAYERLSKAGKSTSDELSKAMGDIIAAEEKAADKSREVWGKFVDTMREPFLEMGDQFTRMLSGMLADWEMQLLSPMLGSYQQMLSHLFGMPAPQGGYGQSGGFGQPGTFGGPVQHYGFGSSQTSQIPFQGPMEPGYTSSPYSGYGVWDTASGYGRGMGGPNWDTYGSDWWYDSGGEPTTTGASMGQRVGAGVVGGALAGFGADTSQGFNHAMITGLGMDSAQGTASTVAMGIATAGISVGVQAAVAAIKYAFRDRTIEDVARDSGEKFGQAWSEELTKKITEAAKMSHNETAAELAFLPDIMKEHPVDTSNLDMYENRTRDIFVMIGQGQFAIAQGAQLLNSIFPQLLESGTNAYGQISEKLHELIYLDETYTTHTKAIADFLKGQGASALAGAFGDYLDYGDQGKVYDEIKSRIDAAMATKTPTSDADAATQDKWQVLQGKVDDALQKYNKMVAKGESTPAQLTAQWAKYEEALAAAGKASPDLQKALDDQAEAAKGAKEKLNDLGLAAVASFAAAAASGMPMMEVFKNAHDGLDRLRKDYSDLGLEVDNPALKTLLDMDKTYGANPKTVSGIIGLTQIESSLGNMNALTPDVFAAQQRTASDMANSLYNAAINNGASGENTDALRIALLPMQTFLHQAEKDAARMHVDLDANTSRMITESKDLGIWTDSVTDVNERLIDRIGDLIRALAGLPAELHAALVAPVGANQGGNSSGGPGSGSGGPGSGGDGSGGTVPSPGHPDVQTASLGGMVTDTGVIYADRGAFIPKGTDTVPAMLTPGEAVLNVKAVERIGPAAVDSLNRGGGVQYFTDGGRVAPTGFTVDGKDVGQPAPDSTFHESMVEFWQSIPHDTQVLLNALYNSDRLVGFWQPQGDPFGLPGDDGLDWLSQVALRTQGAHYESWREPTPFSFLLLAGPPTNTDTGEIGHVTGIMGMWGPSSLDELYDISDRLVAAGAYENLLDEKAIAKYYDLQYKTVDTLWPAWRDSLTEQEFAHVKQLYEWMLNVPGGRDTSLSEVLRWAADSALAGQPIIELSPAMLEAYATGHSNALPEVPTPSHTITLLPANLASAPTNTLYASDGAFVPHGTDVVPAMLTPGERVLDVEETRRYEGGTVTRYPEPGDLGTYKPGPKPMPIPVPPPATATPYPGVISVPPTPTVPTPRIPPPLIPLPPPFISLPTPLPRPGDPRSGATTTNHITFQPTIVIPGGDTGDVDKVLDAFWQGMEHDRGGSRYRLERLVNNTVNERRGGVNY